MRRLLLASLLACATTPPAAEKATAAPEKKPGVDLAGMDQAVKPGDDFFAYTSGTWLKTTEIPPDRASYGVSTAVEELTNQRSVDLIKEAAAKDAPAGSDARKVGDYYASFMDEEGIEQKGLAPLQPLLDEVAAIKDRAGLHRYLGSGVRADVDVLNATALSTDNILGLWIAQDLDDPTKYSPFVLQGGLGMPDRDYYLDPSPRMAEIRTKYEAHLGKVYRLIGAKEPEAKAKATFELEKKIAQVHASRVDSEQVEKGNNHWKRAELSTRAPGLDWNVFLAAVGLDKQEEFVIWQPAAIIGISALTKSEPVETWKDYLTVRAVLRYAAFLPRAFVEERFDFSGRTLTGAQQLRPRWKRGVAATNGALGEVVGKLYVERYFPASEKARAEEMVKNITAAFGKRVDALEWMAPQTKAKAKAKLAVLKVGVGYPDKWRDYSGLEVVRGDALGNARRAALFDTKFKLQRLGQPVDRGEWVMNAHLVNAVNLPAMNALNFPAAILQPPFFDPARPEVMDYGSIGSVIGHEISHSFDSEGALFDDAGRLKNWWTPDDFAHFKASSTQLVKQYDGYRPFPDLNLRGEQTLSENIADVAGLSAAYDAYRLSLGGKEAKEVSGFTGDQQFFISFAQSWRDKSREPALRQQIITDGHSPDEYRADTVRNLDAWYQAFDVKPGEKLYLAPADRVRVW